MTSRNLIATLRRFGRKTFVVGSVVGVTAGALYTFDVLNEYKFKQQMVKIKKLSTAYGSFLELLFSNCKC